MRGLDTYYGRNLKEIRDNADGTWGLVLDGDVHIVNNNKNTPRPNIPDEIVSNLRFAMMTLDPVATTLIFMTPTHDEWRVKLDPTTYQIFEEGESWYPQQPVERQPSPQPHPDERIATGPTIPPNENNKES